MDTPANKSPDEQARLVEEHRGARISASYIAIVSEESSVEIDGEMDGGLVFMDFAALVGADVGGKVGAKDGG